MNTEAKERARSITRMVLVSALSVVVALAGTAYAQSSKQAKRASSDCPAGKPHKRLKTVTGTAAEQAKSAALAEVSGAEVKEVAYPPEGDGYLVFLKTDDGPLVVELDKDFKVTGKHKPPKPPAGARPGGPGGPPPAGDDGGS